MQRHAPLTYPAPPVSATCAYTIASSKSLSQQRGRNRLHAFKRRGALLYGKLRLAQILGTGSYGVVYLAVDLETGTQYAVKRRCKLNAHANALDCRREIRLHSLVSAHPNVVSIVDVLDDCDSTYIIMEYCAEGDLFRNIAEFGRFVGDDEACKLVFLQLLDAVIYCHEQGVYHRDLKPENILVSGNGKVVKVADFGLATYEGRSTRHGCGSKSYMSPECLDRSRRQSYYLSAPNDIWSLGVILINLTCGRSPWAEASLGDSGYQSYTRSKGYLREILPLSAELLEVLVQVFDPNPERRITLPELRNRVFACTSFTVSAAAAATIPARSHPRLLAAGNGASHNDAPAIATIPGG